MTHSGALSRESGTRTDATVVERTTVAGDGAPDLPALPPFADLVSREIRRMGRAWKIEGAKSALHIALTMLLMSVLGAGWLLFIAVSAAVGWYLWSTFSVKATVKPHRIGMHRAPCKEESDSAGDYEDWLVGSEHTSQ